MKEAWSTFLIVLGCIGAVILIGIVALIGVAIWEEMTESYSRAAVEGVSSIWIS